MAIPCQSLETKSKRTASKLEITMIIGWNLIVGSDSLLFEKALQQRASCWTSVTLADVGGVVWDPFEGHRDAYVVPPKLTAFPCFPTQMIPFRWFTGTAIHAYFHITPLLRIAKPHGSGFTKYGRGWIALKISRTMYSQVPSPFVTCGWLQFVWILTKNRSPWKLPWKPFKAGHWTLSCQYFYPTAEFGVVIAQSHDFS